MDVSIVDLRYNMKKVLNALARSEKINVSHYGKLKAILIPYEEENTPVCVQNHPAFGMYKNRKTSVELEVRALRKDRFDDL